jgi:RimJ/RimL family protein N-acetyltransferase
MIETERLLLRRFDPGADLDAFAEIFAKPEVMKYSMYRRGLDRDESHAMLERFEQHWRDKGIGYCAVVEKQTGALVGYAGLQYVWWHDDMHGDIEVGYRFDPPSWGNGFATEAARAWLGYGFDVAKLDRIVALYEPDNAASGAVMRRIGMREFGTTKFPPDGETLIVYEMTRAQRDA